MWQNGRRGTNCSGPSSDRWQVRRPSDGEMYVWAARPRSVSRPAALRWIRATPVPCGAATHPQLRLACPRPTACVAGCRFTMVRSIRRIVRLNWPLLAG